MLKAIYERIGARLEAMGLNEREASLRAGLHADAIRNIRRGAEGGQAGRTGVSARTISALAPVLGTTSAWLLDGMTGPSGDGLPVVDWKRVGDLLDPSAPLVDCRYLGELFGRWPARYFATRAPDEAMNRISPAGSYIVVDRNDRDLVEGHCYLGILEGQLLFRRWASDPARAEPSSNDPGFKIEFLAQDRSWKIIGRVRRTILDI
jgi:hypothetical protein